MLGKELKYGVADSAAKPNDAVQAQQRFITENKAIMITGGTSSAVAVALNKLAQREKVLFVCGISGSNDTTGKDCVRYGFRQNFYGQTAAAAIGPVLVKAFGKNKKAAYHDARLHLRPHRHQVDEGLPQQNGGWTMVTNQVSPLGAPDYSARTSLNIANSGAEFLINVNWGHDAVLSTQQAKQFGMLDKMKLVVPYQMPFLAREVGGLMPGRLRRHRLLVDDRGQVPAGQDVRRGVREEVRLQAGMGRRERLHGSSRMWAEAVRARRHLLSARRDQVLREAAQTLQSLVGEVHCRAEDHQLRPPGRSSSGARSRRT